MKTTVADTKIVQRTVSDLVKGDIFTFDDPELAQKCTINIVGTCGGELGYMELAKDGEPTFWELQGGRPNDKVWLLDVLVKATFKREKRK